MNKHIMFLSLVFPALIFAAVAIVVTVRKRIRPYYANLESLSLHFSGMLSKSSRLFLNQPSFAGKFSEHEFSVTYLTDGRAGYVYGIKVVCRFNLSGKLKIYMYERNPGTVFFAERIYIGDHDFDRYYIYSNMPEEAKRYFSDESRRAAIRELTANGWQLPMITGARISTCSADKRPQPSLDAETLRAALKNLIALVIGHN